MAHARQDIDVPIFGAPYSVDAVVDFVLAYGRYGRSSEEREAIHNAVIDHAKFGTAMVILGKTPQEIIAFARWNYDDPWTVHILDCIVRPDHRCGAKNLVRLMLKGGLAEHPQVLRVTWERPEAKYPGRPPIVIHRKERQHG